MVVMMVSIRDSLTNAKARHADAVCDEYYTGEALARRLIDHCEAIGARKLVLPCDTDASRIAIYARERAAAGAFEDVAVFDDFETALDTVDESYHIVTNPPFSKLSWLIYPRCVDWAGGFTLVASLSSFSYAALRKKWRELFFFRPSDRRESAFDRPDGGQVVIGISCIVSTAYSDYIKKRAAVGVSPDGMPFTNGGYRLTTVKMPKYPYDTKHSIALPLSSLYYDIPDFTPIDIVRNELIGEEILYTKVIWRYNHG